MGRPSRNSPGGRKPPKYRRRRGHYDNDLDPITFLVMLVALVIFGAVSNLFGLST